MLYSDPLVRAGLLRDERGATCTSIAHNALEFLMSAHIGVTGLAVMGANLARNLARNGFTVALHNRSVEKTDALLEKHGTDGDFIRTETLQELVDSLEKPRRVLIMVKAGKPVDSVIEQLEPLLEPGDIIIDAGNSPYAN